MGLESVRAAYDKPLRCLAAVAAGRQGQQSQKAYGMTRKTNIVRLQITLDDVQPPVMRRVAVRLKQRALYSLTPTIITASASD